MGRYQKKAKKEKIMEKQAGALWGTMGRYRNTLKNAKKHEKTKKRKNCKKRAGALWGAIKKDKKRKKLEKIRPGHYGALWGAIATH